ncbi:MAG: zinc-dependent alcohol dehydrogenase family protein [Clostridia bacterium]|nr:zinc-dependent alcohol dehydrogenase family protein [Clostridia bacterium]
MKAAVYWGKNDLRLLDIPVPEVGDRDVLVKIKYCGVCGTDVHIFHGDGGAAPVPEGTVIGHEFSGVVAGAGKGVVGLKAGDRVTVNPNHFCGACYFCQNGKEHFCTSMKGYGTTYNGGFAEYVAVPDRLVFPLPEGLSFEAGSQSETLSCCLNGIDLCRLRTGANVFIIGAGPIGLMMLQLAKMSGAGKIVVSELVQEKRALAMKLGADVTFDPRQQEIGEVLAREFVNVDCIIEAAGTKHTTEQAIRYAGNTCTVMLFGLVAPDTEIVVKPFSIFQRELTITSSFINPYTFTRAVRILGARKVVMDDIITDIVPLEQIRRVFTEERYRKCGKILIAMPD